jgi:AraC-like DNA-binding protein
MQEFYKKALLALIFLILGDALLASFFVQQSYRTLSLLPAKKGAAWRYNGYADGASGGSSTIRVREADRERLKFDYRLSDLAQYPYVSADLYFGDGQKGAALQDWTGYSSVTFLAKCAPANTMVLILLTFDEKISKLGDLSTYKVPTSYFPCSEQGVPVSIELQRLPIPEWWLNRMNLDLSDQAYTLDKVSAIAFGTSSSSRRNVDSQVEISSLTLHGRDYRFLAALAAMLAASLGMFGFWFFRAHARALTASLDSRLEKDLTVVAYRQLTLEPYKDKEKAVILRFISSNFGDTELDLERVAAGTGANRSKVNDVLKIELGMTFTSYLNKLRLTEAASLLAEKSGSGIAEIAYSVGYANVSYFNKLFKDEYGCTPKAFRSLANQQGSSAAPSETEAPASPNAHPPG